MKDNEENVLLYKINGLKTQKYKHVINIQHIVSYIVQGRYTKRENKQHFIQINCEKWTTHSTFGFLIFKVVDFLIYAIKIKGFPLVHEHLHFIEI